MSNKQFILGVLITFIGYLCCFSHKPVECALSSNKGVNFFFINFEEEEFYTAAVVELRPINSSSFATAAEMVEGNLQNYLKTIDEAKLNGADILVFPEATLNYHAIDDISDKLLENAVVIPQLETAPCSDEYSTLLQKLCSSVRQSGIYVLVNLVEKEQCSTVPDNENVKHCLPNSKRYTEDGLDYNMYNTNIVFDRNGSIVSIYRKFNLFMEPEMTQPQSPELALFTSDFGVTFGHFVCFDIFFESPSQKLLDLGVSNILYPSMWFSATPFYTATQVHQGWAFANNINLLSAGANNPTAGCTGSGIFSGRNGALDVIMSPDATRTLLIAKVPKIPNQISERSLGPNRALSPTEMQRLHISELQLPAESINRTLTDTPFLVCEHGKFCCEFDLMYRHIPIPMNKIAYSYRIATFYGNRQMGPDRNCGEVYCAIVACTSSDDTSSCGKRFSDNTNLVDSIVFESIRIKMSVNPDIAVMPTTLNTSILPLHNAYSFTNAKITHKSMWMHMRDHQIETKLQVSQLLSFGLYGRNFAADHYTTST